MLRMQTREKLQLLGIYAHPHDCTHSIGTMGNHVKNGDAATVAVLTDGGATHNERLWEELHKDEDEQDPGVVEQQRQAYAEQKYEEARQACGYFGVTDVRFLGFRDKPVIRTDEMVESVVDLICDVRPDVLITEVPALQTRDRRFAAPDDHTTCAAVVVEALVIAQHPRQGASRVPHKPARLFYAAPGLPGDEVDLFVDVSDWEEERIKAEMSYASQGHTPVLCAPAGGASVRPLRLERRGQPGREIHQRQQPGGLPAAGQRSRPGALPRLGHRPCRQRHGGRVPGRGGPHSEGEEGMRPVFLTLFQRRYSICPLHSRQRRGESNWQ